MKSEKLAMRNINLNADFITDTTKVVKYTNPTDQKTTYTFKIYPYNNQLSEREYFNLVYEKVGDQWNQLIFFIKNKENPLPSENPVESSEMVYNSLSSGYFQQIITYYNFHCNGQGRCTTGICDLCNACVSQTLSYIYITVMPEPGGAGGGESGTSGGGGGASGTSGVFVPVPYNITDINLDSPIWTNYQNFNNFVNALPPNLQDLFNLSNNGNVFNHVYPTILTYFLGNGSAANQTFVQQCLVNYLQIKNTFNPAGWHINEKDSFNLWALRSLLHGYDAIDINILAIKLINIQNTIASQRIVQGLVDNEIDFEFADFLTNKIPLLSFDYSNNEVLEYTNILIFSKKNNYFNQPLDDNYFEGIDDISSLNFPDPITTLNYIRLFRAHCAIIKKENPSWNNWEVFGKAYLDTVQLLLDFVGVVPVFGEWADIANGIIYTIQGDGINATLSYAGAIPVAGWFSTGIKFAKRVDGLKYLVKGANNLISFGAYNSAKFRAACGIAVGDATKQAHHLIPRGSQIIEHEVVQRAAKATNNGGFHIDQALNGIAVATWRNQPNHHQYNNKIYNKLQFYVQQNPNATPNQCYNELLDIIHDAKQAVINNPNVHLNNLNF
jgi:hypothetical protein